MELIIVQASVGENVVEAAQIKELMIAKSESRQAIIFFFKTHQLHNRTFAIFNLAFSIFLERRSIILLVTQKMPHD
jgi:hypothetical protein